MVRSNVETDWNGGIEGGIRSLMQQSVRYPETTNGARENRTPSVEKPYTDHNTPDLSHQHSDDEQQNA